MSVCVCVCVCVCVSVFVSVCVIGRVCVFVSHFVILSSGFNLSQEILRGNKFSVVSIFASFTFPFDKGNLSPFLSLSLG